MKVHFLLAFDSETVPTQDDELIIHTPILVSFVRADVRDFKVVKSTVRARYFTDVNEFNKTVLLELRSAKNRYFKHLKRRYKKVRKSDYFNAVIIAHNTAFDDRATKLSIFLEQNGFELEFEDYDNKFVKILKNKDEQIRVYILDTMNFVKLPLKEVAKAVNLKKLEFDVENIDLDRFLNDRKYRFALIKYNIVDSLIAFRYAQFLIENYKDAFSVTVSSSVLNLFKKEFSEEYKKLTLFSRALKNSARAKQLKNEKLKKLALNVQKHKDKILHLLIASYRGGRVEVFERGVVKDVVVLDVNSMYPFVMRNFPYPVEYLFYAEAENDEKEFTSTILEIIDELKNTVKSQEGAEILYIAEGDFLVKPIKINDKQQIAPVMVRRDSKLYPATGLVHAVLTSAEIEAFPEHIQVLSLRRIIVFKAQKVFEKFVDKYYALKKNAPNEAMKQFAKLNLNSLYGKFGQRNEIKYTFQFNSLEEVLEFLTKETDEKYAKFLLGKLKEDGIVSFIDENRELRITVYQFDESVHRAVKKFLHEYDLSSHSNISIASFVTAYARVYLTKLIIKIAKHSEVFYCDTDSIHAHKSVLNVPELQYLFDDKELGKLKIEEQADYAVYLTLKVYALLDFDKDQNVFRVVKLRAKGIPKRIIEKTIPKEVPADFFIETVFNNYDGSIMRADKINVDVRLNLMKIFNPLRSITFEKFAGIREGLRRFAHYDNILLLVHKEFSFEYDKALKSFTSETIDKNNVLLFTEYFKPAEFVDFITQDETIDDNFIRELLISIRPTRSFAEKFVVSDVPF